MGECAFKEVIKTNGRNASEAKSGLPSEAEEASGRLTASIVHWHEALPLTYNAFSTMPC